MVSLSSYEQFEENKNSLRADYYTYVLLNDGQDADKLQQKNQGTIQEL